MPRIRRSLSQSEQTEHLARAEKLRASGVPIEIPEAWRQQGRLLDVLVSPRDGTVFQSPCGGIKYAIFVRLLARTGLTVVDCLINAIWDDQIVPESYADQDSVCRLGGTEYLRREVLNPRIERGLRLSRGEIVEGWLLASGVWPVPIEYVDFAAPCEVVFQDYLGQDYAASGKLSVLRRARRSETFVRRGTGLYGGDDSAIPRESASREESSPCHLEVVPQEENVENRR